MYRLSTILWLILFASAHYLLVLGSVPAANQLPAMLGTSALNALIFCIILAARWSWVDNLIGGPDKSYKFHRWLGYGAIIFGIGHWVLATPNGDAIVPSLAAVAADSGKYAMIALIGFSILAMFKVVPYHIWKHSHLVMGLLLPVVIFHTFFSRIPIETGGVVWWVLLLISVTGIIAWIRTIFRRFSKSSRLMVSAVYPIKNGVDIRLVNKKGNQTIKWQAGQFASISFDKTGMHEAHPFTIASAPNSEELRLIVGDFGYYTGNLIKQIGSGDHVKIKEISGSFLPETGFDRQSAQIWLAGGLGITAFLSALAVLRPDNGPGISLIYCVKSSAYAIDLYKLMDYAKRLPQLRFYLIKEDLEGYFSSDTFSRLLDDGWQQSQLYVCGPEGLKSVAREAWRQNNCPQQMVEEEFDFRSAVGRSISRR